MRIVLSFPPGALEMLDPSIGIVDPVAGTLTIEIGALQPGEERTIVLPAGVRADAVSPNADGTLSMSVVIFDDARNGADPTPENNVSSGGAILDASAGIPDFLTETGRGRDPDTGPAIDFDELERVFEYEEYPRHLHGRLISLETMQSEANLVGGRTEVVRDGAYGIWNEHYYPSPWNQDRPDTEETREALENLVRWLARSDSDPDVLVDDRAELDERLDLGAGSAAESRRLLEHLQRSMAP